MSNKPTKPNNGGDQQPYIPAGNEDGGEFTFKEGSPNEPKKEENKALERFKINKRIRNIINKCNFCCSKLVKKVEYCASCTKGYSIPRKYRPNSVAKRLMGDYVVQERFFDENGNPHLDIHYTCHGNPKTHPYVPHIHKWINTEGIVKMKKGEKFEWNQNA